MELPLKISHPDKLLATKIWKPHFLLLLATFTMTKNTYFLQVPNTCDDPAWGDIISRIPAPEQANGMRFVERKVLKTSTPNKKNKRGETKNLARQKGTGKRDETLLGSFEKGIDVREMPPKLITEKDDLSLYGGYGRSAIFDELGYSVWVYDIYEFDVSTRNGEDAALSDNGSAKSKPAEKSDYVGALVRRIKDHGWNRDQMVEWFNHIEHCLTKRQVAEYITSAIRQETAEGRIEWFKEHEINQIVANFDPSLIVLNTTDAENGNNQRFIRTARSMMRSYVHSGGNTQGYCLWNSQASSHEGIDDAHVAAGNIMNEFVDECLEFAAAVNFFKTKACEPQKVVFQKIGSDNLVGEVVDYPALG